jgi:hypothetical protein
MKNPVTNTNTTGDRSGWIGDRIRVPRHTRDIILLLDIQISLIVLLLMPNRFKIHPMLSCLFVHCKYRACFHSLQFLFLSSEYCQVKA